MDQKVVFLTGFLDQGLIFLNCERPDMACVASHRGKENDSATIRHRRFEHRDSNAVLQMKRNGLASKDCGKTDARHKACLQGKATRPAIPKQSTRHSKKPLEQIHTELCGPIQVSVGGSRHLAMTATYAHCGEWASEE